MLLMAALCVFALWLIPQAGFSNDVSLYASMAAIFMFGVGIAPAYYIPMSVFCVAYGGPRVGLLMGLVDSVGYACAGFFNYYGGSIAQNYGWDVFLMVLLGCCLAAAALTMRFMQLEAKQSDSSRAFRALQ